MDENKLNNEITPEENVPFSQETDMLAEDSTSMQAADEPSQEVLSPAKEQKQDMPPTYPAYTYKWDYTAQNQHNTELGKKKKSTGLFTYAIIMSIAFVVSIALLVGVMAFDTPEEPTIQDASIADLYDFCLPSYVAISTIGETGGEGAGSGIIMTENGYICTNYHVVEDAETIKVILHDERMYTAEYIDGNELNDIAIIKINVSDLTPAKIGSSQDSRVGDQVMAIGTPYGIDYRGTMTSGYISALDRQYVLRNESGTVNKVQKMIQTDTSVNPGNSGGPLFNTKGEVIGVVAMKIAGYEYEGMGFAIPIESVMDIINDVIENGKITTSTGGAYEGAALGITGIAVRKGETYVFSGDKAYYVFEDPETGKPSINVSGSSYYDIFVPIDDKDALLENEIYDPIIYTAPVSGVRINGTTPGFHSNEVLKVDDIIVEVNGTIIEQMSNLQDVIAKCVAGDKLEMKVYRNGDIVSVTVELGSSSTMENSEEE